jgi:hypothetical protein
MLPVSETKSETVCVNKIKKVVKAAKIGKVVSRAGLEPATPGL